MCEFNFEVIFYDKIFELIPIVKYYFIMVIICISLSYLSHRYVSNYVKQKNKLNMKDIENMKQQINKQN